MTRDISNGNYQNKQSTSRLDQKSTSPKKKAEKQKLKRRDSREIFKEMSKAELEILAIKTEGSKSMNKQLKKKLNTLGNDDEKTVPFKATSDIMDVLYRTVIPHQHPNLESHKSHFDIMQEVYDHTENKSDVTRNMLAMQFLKNPNRFDPEHKEIKSILKNEIIWPQGHIPEELKIDRFKAKKTKE